MSETRCCRDADAAMSSSRSSANRTRTSDLYRTSNLPERFDHPSWFYGYGIQRKPAVHPCYRTTSSDYGRSVYTHPSTTIFFLSTTSNGCYFNSSAWPGLSCLVSCLVLVVSGYTIPLSFFLKAYKPVLYCVINYSSLFIGISCNTTKIGL